MWRPDRTDRPHARARADDLGPADLLILRAALQAGAAPVTALALLDHACLVAANASLRVGTPLATVLADDPDLPPAAAAVLRTLAMADTVGSAAAGAIDRVLDGVVAHQRLSSLVRTRSAQAVTSARLLIALPIAGCLGLTMLDGGARAVMLSPGGVLIILVASLLIGPAVMWMRLLVARVAAGATSVDPLAGRRGGGTRPAHGILPTVEVLDLMALGLSSGVGMAESVMLTARLCDPRVAPALVVMSKRLRSGMTPALAVPEELAELGRLLEVSERFGAPTAEALGVLADDIRDRAAAAAEAAAERLTVHLVFPTTLLLVPAFALLVVVPTLASSLGGSGL